MGNSIKFKIAICIISVLLLLGVSIIRNNFYKKITYKKWSSLEWSDFNGIPKPFTSFEAAIFSDVYLEYDTISNRYITYAAQNNQKSWKKEIDTSGYLLNHEQYHFNIAEVFARKMNTFIKDNPNKNLKFYNQKLESLKDEENEMQQQYDDESNHSISLVSQRKWEYKIDSLLQFYDNKDGYVTDYYSGAKIYFPQSPEFEKDVDSLGDYSSRIFILNKYGMEFLLMSFQYLIPEFEDVENSVKEYYKENKLEINSFEKSNISGDKKIAVIVEDTIHNDEVKNLWLYSKDYFYKLTVRYPSEHKDKSKYVQIADNFINSFEIINTDSYWEEKFQLSKLQYTYRDLKKTQPKDWDCLVYNEEKQYVFFRGPIYLEDNSSIIVQDIPNKVGKDIKYNFLKLDDYVFQYEINDTVNQFLYIPKEHLSKDSFEIEFGYVPIEKDQKDCYYFNYQSLIITPSLQTP